MHNEIKKQKHVFEELGTMLTSQQLENIVENLSSKIQITNECKNQIIEESSKLVVKIANSRMQTLDMLNKRHQHYVFLMSLCQKSLLDDDLTEINRELRTSLMKTPSTLNFPEIDTYFSSDFLRDHESIQYTPSLPIPRPSPLLSINYGSFLETRKTLSPPTSITSNSDYIVSGGADNSITIWNLKTKTQESVLLGHTSVVRGLAITSDSTYIVSGGYDRTVRIWRREEKTQEGVLEGHTECVRSVAVTRDSQYIVSAGDDKVVRIWKLKDKVQVAVLEGHTHTVSSVVVTSDDRYVVSGGYDMTVRVWNMQDWTQETVLQGHTHPIFAIAVTNDNNYIVSGGADMIVMLWNIQEKRYEASLEGHTGYVKNVAITSDNNYAVSEGDDTTVRIWNLKDRRQESILTDYDDTALQWSLKCPEIERYFFNLNAY